MLSSLRAASKARAAWSAESLLRRRSSSQKPEECGGRDADFSSPRTKWSEIGRLRRPGASEACLWRSRGVVCYRNVSEGKQSCGKSRSSMHGIEQLVLLLKHPGSGQTLGLPLHPRKFCSSEGSSEQPKTVPAPETHSEKAVVTALWCNFLVLALKCGVWFVSGSHVLLAEAVHSLADLANQGLLAYGLVSSRRAPDALHPYGYSKERFVWSLISAVGIFCLGAGATIVHGISNLWQAEPIDNMLSAAIVIAGSMGMEGASLYVAVNAVKQGAAAEGMKWQEYIWQGHDPTSVAVMMEDSAAVTGLVIAALSLGAVHVTGNPIWDPLGSILVGNLLGIVAIFLIQRNRHALLGRSMDPKDVKRVLDFLSADPVVDAIYDCKSEVIGPGSYRFKVEIDFDGVAVVHNFLERMGRESWMTEFQEAAKDPQTLETALTTYGQEVVAALGSEVDRLEKEIQKLVPGVHHVDIEAHNPKGPSPYT